ncbi:MAG: hypothetical protein ACREMY_27050, partial [bacterium]
TGPQTEAGKQSSKMNALQHGLASAQIVLPHEDSTAFEDLKTTLIAEHQPAGQIEQLLATQLAETWWRVLRARRVESEYLNRLVAAAPGSGDAAIADAVTAEKDNAFSKIQRYVNAADRAFKNVLRQLQEVQQIRRHEEQLQRLRSLNPNRRPALAPEIGFVSQPSQRTAASGSTDGAWLRNPPPKPAEAPLKLTR